jgi:hypothetical protein
MRECANVLITKLRYWAAKLQVFFLRDVRHET